MHIVFKLLIPFQRDFNNLSNEISNLINKDLRNIHIYLFNKILILNKMQHMHKQFGFIAILILLINTNIFSLLNNFLDFF